jgi:HSP20 family molecular chaperone IbpA
MFQLWPVKPDKAEATYEHGLLRIEVPLKDPMENAVKLAIRASDWRKLGS